MSKIGFLFAGQGSQYVGMGREFYENFEEGKKVFECANDALGFSISDICFYDSEGKLNKTEYTQPSIVATNMAILKVLESQGIKSDISCGLSLGEYSALINNGVIDFTDAIKLVKKRGKFMQEAVPENVGGMTAVLKLSKEVLLDVIESVDGVVEIANYNSPNQIVISGELNALAKAEELIKEKGGRAIRLNVSAPFHSSMLEPAAKNLFDELEKVDLREPKGIVMSNLKGNNYETSDDIRGILRDQVKKSVLFVDNIEAMKAHGVDIFVEIGPGKVLSNFIKKIDKNLTIFNVEDLESLNNTIEKLKEMEVTN